MDWPALRLSLWLGLSTVVILLPFALWLGRHLALQRFAGRGVIEAAVALPLVLPPTVLGFYLLTAFGAIPPNLREAGATSGMTPWAVFRRVELPLAWPGIATAIVLTFAHTLGEFGVVLMVGGAIPGETRTAAIAIYDRVQAFDDAAAASMSALLLVICLVALLLVQRLTRGIGRRRHG